MLDRQAICEFVNREIIRFHESRLERLKHIGLNEVLRKKNPYLFRAKNLHSAAELVEAILQAFLSSSEEELFGTFLEELAIFVAESTTHGRKSSAQGIDLEFDRDGTRYLVAIKSGPNWGNSSQHARLEQDFTKAMTVQKQSHRGLSIQPVLGICYGRTRTVYKGPYVRYTGQEFWHFLSLDPNLYLEVIEPIGYRAKEHNEYFEQGRSAVSNRLIHEFVERFCTSNYNVDWHAVVRFNSGNMKEG